MTPGQSRGSDLIPYRGDASKQSIHDQPNLLNIFDEQA